MLKSDLNRRKFLKITAGTGAALAMPTLGQTAVAAAPSKMIGIQAGAVSFVDEGMEKGSPRPEGRYLSARRW
jgi:hypothetical protein